MADPRDYKLDISGLGEGEPTEDDSSRETPVNDPSPAGQSRPFLRVLFACCNVYLRVYRSPDDTHYHAACPKCSRPVRFQVGPGGTESRDFVVR